MGSIDHNQIREALKKKKSETFSVFSKLLYGFNKMSVEIPVGYFIKLDKVILKVI